MKKFESVVGKNVVSFDDLNQMRSMANDLKGNPDQNIKRLASNMVKTIDDKVASLSPKDVVAGQTGIDEAIKTISSARKDWRNLSRATTLEDILNVAEAKALDPKASESELIRRGFINLAANKNQMKLFTENEQNAIRSVAKGGSLDTLLSFAARFNPERSQLVAGGTVAGGIAKPEVVLPIATTGYAADKLQSLLRQRAANQAISGLLTGTTPAPIPSTTWRGLMSGAMQPPMLE